MTTFWLVLTSPIDCLGLGLSLGLLSVGGLVGMVRVKIRDGWGIMHRASKCPHKDGSTKGVCV